MPVVFDCRSAIPQTTTLNSHLEVVQHAKKVAAEIVESRSKEKQPHIVPVIHRKTGEIRWFNVKQEPSNLGWMTFAEALISPDWRLASKAEETAALEEEARLRKEIAQEQLYLKTMAAGAQVSAMATNANFKQLVRDAGALEEKTEDDKKAKGDKK